MRVASSGYSCEDKRVRGLELVNAPSLRSTLSKTIGRKERSYRLPLIMSFFDKVLSSPQISPTSFYTVATSIHNIAPTSPSLRIPAPNLQRNIYSILSCLDCDSVNQRSLLGLSPNFAKGDLGATQK